MTNNITFKTELNEIITVEEVAILFDSITKKYETELISLSLFPQYYKLRKNVIEKTIAQRNEELSRLLTEIANRKQIIKINMWRTLSNIGKNKKAIENNIATEIDLEQLIYEEEQIIKVYENIIKTLDRKEKKIMNGKYSRLDKIVPISRKKTLKKQLEDLRKNILTISTTHNDCFAEFMSDLDKLIDGTITSVEKVFPKHKSNLIVENYETPQSIKINTDEEEDNRIHYVRRQEIKDFYSYEPDEEDPDDELIFQLLNQGKYDDEDGTINGLILINDIVEYEEA